MKKTLLFLFLGLAMLCNKKSFSQDYNFHFGYGVLIANFYNSQVFKTELSKVYDSGFEFGLKSSFYNIERENNYSVEYNPLVSAYVKGRDFAFPELLGNEHLVGTYKLKSKIFSEQATIIGPTVAYNIDYGKFFIVPKITPAFLITKYHYAQYGYDVISTIEGREEKFALVSTLDERFWDLVIEAEFSFNYMIGKNMYTGLSLSGEVSPRHGGLIMKSTLIYGIKF
jgi:hypothetical protein